jgi:hypothetical protein
MVRGLSLALEPGGGAASGATRAERLGGPPRRSVGRYPSPPPLTCRPHCVIMPADRSGTLPHQCTQRWHCTRPTVSIPPGFDVAGLVSPHSRPFAVQGTYDVTHTAVHSLDRVRTVGVSRPQRHKIPIAEESGRAPEHDASRSSACVYPSAN